MDRIEKQVVLKAPRAKVWKALADAQEFGKWFGCAFEGAFEPGATVHGKIVGVPEHEGTPILLFIEKIEREKVLAFRWHPHAVDPKTDYSKEPTTLVTFELAEAPGGTKLTLTESGFDKVPLERRALAFERNDAGWAEQMRRIERHVS
jgi:uncharacterized protein YndB with AHSA1/START domain